MITTYKDAYMDVFNRIRGMVNQYDYEYLKSSPRDTIQRKILFNNKRIYVSIYLIMKDYLDRGLNETDATYYLCTVEELNEEIEKYKAIIKQLESEKEYDNKPKFNEDGELIW